MITTRKINPKNIRCAEREREKERERERGGGR